MAEVTVRVGGRSYSLLCRDGGEARLEALAARIDAQARALGATLGPMAEGRLLLSVALTLADRLDETEAALLAAAERVEALAAALEDGGDNA